ncbi:unnamed protein product [Cyclocybe aegerita]|uniref:Uncharacterized protein n=1 Tax=Cyclocybe aegerita TaxID=1973307 RepID=A0A8S0XXH7_CYCAE|nr:unnamed protein product [Cyclocybe aegerita]
MSGGGNSREGAYRRSGHDRKADPAEAGSDMGSGDTRTCGNFALTVRGKWRIARTRGMTGIEKSVPLLSCFRLYLLSSSNQHRAFPPLLLPKTIDLSCWPTVDTAIEVVTQPGEQQHGGDASQYTTDWTLRRASILQRALPAFLHHRVPPF